MNTLRELQNLADQTKREVLNLITNQNPSNKLNDKMAETLDRLIVINDLIAKITK